MARKSLKTLIRLRDWDVDEKRRAVGELLGAIAALEAQAQKLESDLVAEQKTARDDPNEAGILYGFYANAVIQRREELAEAMRRTEEAIAEAQDRLRDAYRELKKYEVLQQHRDEAEAEAEKHREQLFLDEVAQQAFVRKQAD